MRIEASQTMHNAMVNYPMYEADKPPPQKRCMHWGPYWGRPTKHLRNPIKQREYGRIWRTRRDSNSRPLPSEGSAAGDWAASLVAGQGDRFAALPTQNPRRRQRRRARRKGDRRVDQEG